MDDPNIHAYEDQYPDDAEIGRRWRENSSLERWFPLTAEELQRLRADRARLSAETRELRARLFELRALLDSRPALNAGLLEAYVKWTGEVYALDWLNALDAQGGA